MPNLQNASGPVKPRRAFSRLDELSMIMPHLLRRVADLEGCVSDVIAELERVKRREAAARERRPVVPSIRIITPN
jgi:hypothetical protein